MTLMKTRRFILAACCGAIAVAALCGRARAGEIDMALVTVGDLGNAPDPMTNHGAVPYVYNIGKYDVTTAQYTAFLNAVASSGDPYGLYAPKMATDLPTDGITPISINKAGQILAEGGNAQGVYHDFVLTPTAEPSTSALLFCLACFFLILQLCRRRLARS